VRERLGGSLFSFFGFGFRGGGVDVDGVGCSSEFFEFFREGFELIFDLVHGVLTHDDSQWRILNRHDFQN